MRSQGSLFADLVESGEEQRGTAALPSPDRQRFESSLPPGVELRRTDELGACFGDGAVQPAADRSSA